MLIRSVKSQMKKIPSRGEMNAANATMHPHMVGRLREPREARCSRVTYRRPWIKCSITPARSR